MGGLGLTANWTLEPPVSTPTSRMIASDASRRTWYSLSVSVRIGATVTESPVWTPIASMFSMPQTMTQLSLRSRTTSSSYSFQPSSDLSTWTCPIMLASDAAGDELVELVVVVGDAAPPPAEREGGADDRGQADLFEDTPGLVEGGDGLGFGGREVGAGADLGEFFWRSSALLIASRSAPIISMPNSASTPESYRAQAQLRPVCPPSVGRTASMGVPAAASFSMIFSDRVGRDRLDVGPVAKAGSVMIVAGLELTKTTR
jgi:hypothetical protein